MARVRFEVRVVPRAVRNAVGGTREGAILVRVTAPPADGAANDAVVRLVADALALPAGDVVIERGHRGRRKVLSVPAAAGERLARLK